MTSGGFFFLCLFVFVSTTWRPAGAAFPGGRAQHEASPGELCDAENAEQRVMAEVTLKCAALFGSSPGFFSMKDLSQEIGVLGPAVLPESTHGGHFVSNDVTCLDYIQGYDNHFLELRLDHEGENEVASAPECECIGTQAGGAHAEHDGKIFWFLAYLEKPAWPRKQFYTFYYYAADGTERFGPFVNDVYGQYRVGLRDGWSFSYVEKDHLDDYSGTFFAIHATFQNPGKTYLKDDDSDSSSDATTSKALCGTCDPSCRAACAGKGTEVNVFFILQRAEGIDGETRYADHVPDGETQSMFYRSLLEPRTVDANGNAVLLFEEHQKVNFKLSDRQECYAFPFNYDAPNAGVADDGSESSSAAATPAVTPCGADGIYIAVPECCLDGTLCHGLAISMAHHQASAAFRAARSHAHEHEHEHFTTTAVKNAMFGRRRRRLRSSSSSSSASEFGDDDDDDADKLLLKK